MYKKRFKTLAICFVASYLSIGCTTMGMSNESMYAFGRALSANPDLFAYKPIGQMPVAPSRPIVIMQTPQNNMNSSCTWCQPKY